MKKINSLIACVVLFLINPIFGQEFVDLQNGEDAHINGLLVTYSSVKKETKKGSDLYKIILSITNHGNDYLRVFSQSTETFVEKAENALAYFQFTNANGKALSATSARMYPKPLRIKVPYKCKKCPPPTDKDEDPYNHFTKSVIIGTQFVSGSTLSKTYNIRVPEGEIPTIRAMIY